MSQRATEDAAASQPYRRPMVGRVAGWVERRPILAVAAVLSLATALRLMGLWTWSLWEDEEATIHYALNLYKAFPSLFPIFFLTLRGVFEVTGVSVEAARSWSALVGLASIGVAGWIGWRWFGVAVGIGTGLLLAVNLGHLFWSQSVRYYLAGMTFQLVAFHLFLAGFEERRFRALVLSSVALTAALLCHFSAVLLVPVMIGHLFVVAWWRDWSGAYNLRGYLVFGVPLVACVAAFATRIMAAQGMMGSWVMPSARDPLHVVLTLVAYFGVPVFALAGAGCLGVKPTNYRRVCAFVLLGVVPVLELLVITTLNVINVTWYYGLVALCGLAILSARGLLELAATRPRLADGLAAAAIVYSLAFLVPYFTTGYGDRSRWHEAATFVRQQGWSAGQADARAVYASVPPLAAFYLGIDPSQTQGHPLLRGAAYDWPPAGASEWHLVTRFSEPAWYLSWVDQHCQEAARFPAHTGPRDRTVVVYRCAT